MPNIDTGLFINTSVGADRATATMARRALGALLASSSTTGQPAPGILGQNGGGLYVSANSTSALLFSVAAGYAVVTRSAAPSLGGYICGSTAAVPITLAAANGSNPRIDLVYICQPDPEAGDSTHARIDVITGTPAASPVAPTASLPQGALALASITVPANATAASACAVTDLRVQTGLANGNRLIKGDQSGLPTSWGYNDRIVVSDPTNAGSNAKNVTYRPGPSGWKPWESDWIAYTPTFFTGWGSTGYTNLFCRFRWVNGRVRYNGQFTLNTGSPTNDLTRISLPIDSISGDAGASPIRAGHAFGFRNGTGRFQLQPTLDTPSRFAFSYYSSTGTGQFAGLLEYAMYNNTPVAWASGDTFGWDFEYDVT